MPNYTVSTRKPVKSPNRAAVGQASSSTLQKIDVFDSSAHSGLGALHLGKTNNNSDIRKN